MSHSVRKSFLRKSAMKRRIFKACLSSRNYQYSVGKKRKVSTETTVSVCIIVHVVHILVIFLEVNILLCHCVSQLGNTYKMLWKNLKKYIQKIFIFRELEHGRYNIEQITHCIFISQKCCNPKEDNVYKKVALLM